MRRRWLVVLLVSVGCGSQPDVGLSPTRGRASGGVAVELRGREFTRHGAVVVYFGEVIARQVVVYDDRTLSVRTPPLPEGRAPVLVQFTDGHRVEMPEPFVAEPGPIQITARRTERTP